LLLTLNLILCILGAEHYMAACTLAHPLQKCLHPHPVFQVIC
jgi:hypothetical protein